MALPSRLPRWPWAAVFLALLLGGTARAGDPLEFWPELNLYEGLSPTTRLYLVTAYGTGKESALRTLDLAGYFDLTLKPRLVQHLSVEESDWQRNRFLWVRFGYDYVARAEGETRIAPEHRGIVALSARAYLPEEILVELRARADLRWIEGDYSTRYRLRLEVNREFSAWGHPLTPWIQAEAFYDTRYDGWARALYQAGAELGVTEHFRLEPSLARQVDSLPGPSGLWAFALVARWYY
jgi:hypothetical protein